MLICCPFVAVWVKLACTFRYGRDDFDIIGLSFKKDIWVEQIQIYPSIFKQKPANTSLQDALIKKAGEGAHPFTFNVCKTAHYSVLVEMVCAHDSEVCHDCYFRFLQICHVL